MTTFKKMAPFALALALLSALSACNTMEGVGEDVKNAGEWIEEKAKK